MAELKLTAIYEKAEESGYVGYVAELPGANTQGETMEEVREKPSRFFLNVIVISFPLSNPELQNSVFVAALKTTTNPRSPIKCPKLLSKFPA